MLFECQRLAALRACSILDTGPHPAFDGLARAVALAFDAPVAVVALMDADRLWFKASYGAPVREVARSEAICNHTIEGHEPLIIPDARLDARVCQLPMVVGEPHIRFYAGAPLIDSDGYAIGTLSAVDLKPRRIEESQVRLLGYLADVTMHAIEAHRQRLEIQDVWREINAKGLSRPDSQAPGRRAG